MATIVERKRKKGFSYVVVYYYRNELGKKKQKWETFHSKKEAKARLVEVEYINLKHEITNGELKTVEDLIKKYVSIYGTTHWGVTTYPKNIATINNYIIPLIGKVKLRNISTMYLENFYKDLLETPGVVNPATGKGSEKISLGVIKEIHKILHSAFKQAVKWHIFIGNPASGAGYVKQEETEKEVWDIKTAKHAVKVCKNNLLKLVLNLLIACTLRFGELRGLSWDCIDISKKAIDKNTAFIYVDKQIQRVKKEALEKVKKEEVILTFPIKRKSSQTVLVLKKLKTKKSIRKIYVPKTVAVMLCEWKEEQDRVKEIMGAEYKDYNLVFADYNGLPMGDSKIRNAFSEFIEENNLPKVDLHSLRHLSVGYKLKLTNGDIKSTQGDSGHSQANMVTDTYAHIFDDDRKEIALLFEEKFYAD